MPSDPRAVQTMLAPATEAFADVLAATVEDIRRFLDELRLNTGEAADRFEAELGPFGAANMDTGRFGALFGGGPAVDSGTRQTVEQALATVQALADLGPKLFHTQVRRGQSLTDGVSRALAEVGRAFGAARVVATVRAGRYALDQHARSLGSFPFARWSRAERQVAPPLLVEVAGDDLRVGGLAEFLDGRQKLVLLVDGACPPAALVRLLGPRCFVMQTAEHEELAAFIAYPGPGIAAIVPDQAARFTHDPTAGRTTADRLAVEFLPDPAQRRKTAAGLSSAQQADELELLAALRQQPQAAPAAPAAEPVPAAAPADKLAAWLLSQTDVSDLG